MPLSASARILQDRLHPRVVELWQALAPLQTVVSFMNTGAHPDDEMSSMLAALGWRDGIDLSYACSTRGEGGQNDIGTETGAALGVLRTLEMEQACEVLDLSLYWLSQHPDDPVCDFGFSKSGEETLGRWGRDRTLRRFVEIIRLERPDIICPTFLDVPGQHGHHRAMTAAAHEVMDLAADPGFNTGQSPWQVGKLYLPAWSGAGQAYDDDLPPPPETLRIAGAGRDPVTGFSYARIGQQSRVFHRTQGMGRWVAPGAGQDWPLHLADSRVNGPDVALSSGLAATLADLDLAGVQAHFDAARQAFPDTGVILAEVSAGLGMLQSLEAPPEHAHKIRRKKVQAARVIRLAAGVTVDASLTRELLQDGDDVSMTLALQADIDDVSASLVLPDGWSADGESLHLDGAVPAAPMPDHYRATDPALPCVEVSVRSHGVASQTRLPLSVPAVVVPERRVAFEPRADIINLGAERRRILLRVEALSRAGATCALQVPEAWDVTEDDAGFAVDVSDALPGHYPVAVMLEGEVAQTTRIIGESFEHVSPRALSTPAVMQVHVIDCCVPASRIAYVGGGNDQVDHWLSRAGFDVTSLSDEALMSPATLEHYDALVIGIFAMKFRQGLLDAMAHVHQWVEGGGNLLTLYHRPWDNWDANTTPPRRLDIGQPSLRWRVTDPDAAVTHLADHPVLSHPNVISTRDWEGWSKERGLYFAREWDDSYTALIEMADPDEAPLQGALLSADIGAGRHSHCALILHHQLAHGVSGAYRLMANLLAPRV